MPSGDLPMGTRRLRASRTLAASRLRAALGRPDGLGLRLAHIAHRPAVHRRHLPRCARRSRSRSSRRPTCSRASASALFAGVWVDRLPPPPDHDRRRPRPRRHHRLGADRRRVRRAARRAALRRRVSRRHPDDVLRRCVPDVPADARRARTSWSRATASSPPSASVAEFGAFSVAGWLVQLVTAPGAMAVDAVSFLFSAASLASIRTAGARAARREQSATSVRAEIVEGPARSSPRRHAPRAGGQLDRAAPLRPAVFGAVFVLYVTRDLGFSPGVQGVIYGVGGLTSLLRRAARGLVPAALRRGRRDDRRA